MEPKSTVDNSMAWRLWHGINYMIGGVTFYIGSFVLFPFLTPHMDNSVVSAWFYTVGSLAFLLADITEWLHFTLPSCHFFWISVNFFTSVTGSTFYLIGSIQFLPFVNASNLGYLFFIIGSSFIVVSQCWKMFRTLSQPGKSVKQCYDQDQSGFLVDLFAGLGGLMYFIGSFILQNPNNDPNSTAVYIGVAIYTLGGVFFTLSGVFMQKRYFCENNKHNQYELARTSH